MKGPNFFIAGAPKCGTTALSAYLGEHPDIFVSVPKEPFFHTTDLPGLRKVATEEDYLRLFPQGNRQPSCIGEASTLYLYSDRALPRIFAARPDSKIVAMFRNPVDLVMSYHAQLLYGLFEEEPDLAVAWRLQVQRRSGHSLPRTCSEPGVLQYGEVARLGTQLERALTIFPRDQVHTILFDDFVADPGASYRRVLRFLGVQDDERARFPKINEAKAYRFRPLAALKGHLTQRHPRLQQGLRNLLTATKTDQFVLRAFARPIRPRPLSNELRDELTGFFEPEIDLLSRLLDRDLSHWLHVGRVDSP